ncbi:MAG: tripartite tricarboxylate transporter substrate binding protein [Burkholderiales bacterium]
MSLAIAASAFAGDIASAQSYPTKPIRMLVGYVPGGATDLSARMLAARFSETLGQQVIVDNRSGASGMIATALLVRAAPDGYTLMVVDSSHVANPAVNEKMPYDTLKDIAGVSLILRVPMLLLVNPSFPAKSVKDLVALAKANPGKYNYGSAGLGSTMYLVGELFKSSSGIDLGEVAYKGGGPALADVVSGQIPITWLSIAGALSFVKAGRVRALAISGRERSPSAPEVPTVAESGLPGFEFYLCNVLIAPAGMPRPIMTRLNSETVAALKHAETKERLVALGAEPAPSTPQEADAYIRSEVERWIRILKPAAQTRK